MMSALFTTSSKLSLVNTSVTSGGGVQLGWEISLTLAIISERNQTRLSTDKLEQQVLHLTPEAGGEGQTEELVGAAEQEMFDFLKSNHISSQCCSAILRPQSSVKRSTALHTTCRLLNKPTSA